MSSTWQRLDDAVLYALVSYSEIIFSVQGSHCNALSKTFFQRSLWLLCFLMVNVETELSALIPLGRPRTHSACLKTGSLENP